MQAQGQAQAQAQAPLSAIDWLSQSVAAIGPAAGPSLPQPPRQPVPGRSLPEPPISPGVNAEAITVTALDAVSLDGLGLTPSARSNLPRDLWAGTSTSEVVRLLREERTDTLPAIRALLYRLLLAELDPPSDSDASGQLFLARVDRLLDMGALDPALALLELAPDPGAELFRRWFDVALLTGNEDRACEAMRAAPGIAPTFPARIYCLARGSDWNAAALTLQTGEALGRIDAETGELLARFLDPELADGAEDLPAPTRISPLNWRLMEAVGQPLPTTTLPLAFAQADLRSNSGWKTRLEAGERLARSGAIDANRLWGLYTERAPAASGGVWDRVAAVQALDGALAADDRGEADAALRLAWPMMVAMELEVPFADAYGERLAGMGLIGPGAALAFRIGLLSPAAEAIARAHAPEDETEAFLAGLALGDATRGSPPGRMGAAIRAGFDPSAPLAPAYAGLLSGGMKGEAVLQAMLDVTEGARGDLRRVSDGLMVLRRAGLEATARQAALQLLLLERRG